MARTYRRWKYRTANPCPATGKTSFRSTTAARSFVETRDSWNAELARVYSCPACDWYHLTSQETNWALERQAA